MATFEANTDPVYALAVIPADAPDGVCFAARASGLFRSDDCGDTWQSTYQSLKLNAPLDTTALAFSPAFAQDRTMFAGVPGGVLRSTDAGENWRFAVLPDPPPQISALAVSPAYAVDGFVLATTFRRGVLYSTDRGEIWLTGNFSLLDYHVLTVVISPDFASDRTALIGTETGAFSSNNGGRSWQDVDLPYAAVTTLAFAPDGQLYAGTEGDGMFVSSDKGQSWTRANLQSTLIVDLILTPPTHELLVFAVDRLYVSRDRGERWQMQALRTSVTAAATLHAGVLLVGYADGTISRVELQH